MAIIAVLDTVLGAKTGGFQKGMKDAGQAAGGFEGMLNKGVSALSKVAGPLAAVAAAVYVAKKAWDALKFAVAETNKEFEEIDKLAKSAITLDMDVSQVQAFQLASRLAGPEIDTLQKAMQKLQESAFDASEGLGSSAKDFERLGINAKTFVDLNPAEQYKLFADRLSEVANQSEKTAIASGLLGRGAKNLMPLFAEGGKAIDEATGFLKKYNLEISNQDASKVEAANDAWTKLRTVVSGFFQRLAIEAAPTVQLIADKFLELAANEQLIEDFFKMVETGAGLAIAVVEDLAMMIDGIIKLSKLAAFVLNPFDSINVSESPVSKVNEEFETVIKRGSLVSAAVDGMTDSFRQNESVLLDSTTNLKNYEAAQKKLMDSGAALTASLRTPFEVARDELAMVQNQFFAGAISFETKGRAIRKILSDLQGAGAQTEPFVINVASAGRGSQEAFTTLYEQKSNAAETIAEDTLTELEEHTDLLGNVLEAIIRQDKEAVEINQVRIL